jgi:hypothetical protein
MTGEESIRPIVQHIRSKIHYEYMGQDRFKNLVTGQEGIVDEETASKVFVMCLELTETIKEYPDVLGLLKLGFKQK